MSSTKKAGPQLFLFGILTAITLHVLDFRRQRRKIKSKLRSAVPKITLNAVRKVPKVELHAHINGSIPSDLLRELILEADKTQFKETNGMTASQYQRTMLEAVNIREGDSRSLKECFALFDIIHSVVRTPATVTRITRACVLSFARDGCIYLELRSTPRRDLMSADEYVAAVELGLFQAEQQAAEMSLMSRSIMAITTRLILSINRAHGIDEARSTVDLALKLAARPNNKYVVGVELSGNPYASAFSAFKQELNRARCGGLAVSLHAGEIENPKEVSDMIDFRPNRLGHALFLSVNHVDKILTQPYPIPIEICPTSNRLTLKLTSLREHPTLSTWITEQHPFSICTDDCGVFGTELSREYFDVATTHGLTRESLYAIALQSMKDSFAQKEVKESISERIKHAYLAHNN